MKKHAASILMLISFSIAGTSLALAQDASGTPFPDVDSTQPYEVGISYLKDAGVISGYPDGTYKPDAEINRAEFTKIVIGAITADPVGTNCFPDVKDEWFAKYVCEAKTRNIIGGYPDGTFKPADNIKFSEASKIVANALGVPLEALGDPAAPNWYEPYVVGLEMKAAIPLSVKFFDENITRDEMAEMIYRLKAKKTDLASRTYEEITGEEFVTVDTCAALQNRYLEMQRLNNYYPYYRDGVIMEESAGEPAMAPAEGAKSTDAGLGGGGAEDYSTTNIQVAGVDEADIIKNDGKYIYLIKANTVRIVEAYPPENMKELISFSLGVENESFYPTELYVAGNQMTVVGNTSYTTPVVMDSAVTQETTTTTTDKMIAPYPYPYYVNRSKVFVVDITDRSKPKVTRSVEFDGNYSTSRKVGNTLYLVMNQYPYYMPLYYDPAGTTETTSPNDFIPKMRDSKDGADKMVAPCNQIRILPKPETFNFIIAAAIPLTDLTKEVDTEVLVGDSQNLYASTTGMYIAGTDWGGGFYRPYSDYDTYVYHFALGDGTVGYKDKAKVPGTILNQFSMDEHNGAFRIATTRNEFVPGSEINNNLYIFDTNGMGMLGKIENIAPGEKIYSTRFVGDRGYMVTFKRIDPLFVLDLVDPKNPKLEGKLKIPGYSTYLHPYDENHLLGFGNDVDETDTTMSDSDFLYYTAVQGLKISLFDVTDISNPKEMFSEVIGDRGTYSELLYNHKALLFDREKELLAFPIQVMEIPDPESCTSYTYSSCPTSCQKVCVPSTCTYENGIKVCTTDCDGENSCVQTAIDYGVPTFSGAYVYNVNLQDGFTLKGKITHYTDQETADAKINGWFTDYQKTIQRVLYIGEYLYTVSQKNVKANNLSDLVEKNVINLAGDAWDYYYAQPL